MFGINESGHYGQRAAASPGIGCGGFSLLEVLIAGTVFSLGLAGLAALLLASVIGSAEARREGIASVAAASLAEQIRLNPGALERFLDPPARVSRVCGANERDPCTAGQRADFDFRLWQLELADSIPGARGIVCRDSTPLDGLADNVQCDGSGPLVIKIFWSGPGKATGPDSNRHRFTLEVG